MAQEKLQEQIKWLEEQLEAKRQALGNAMSSKESHEVVREVFQDIAHERLFLPSPVAGSRDDDDDIKKQADEQEYTHEYIVDFLVQRAISKDLFSALKAANQLKNPHLIDDFHDRIARHYDALLKAHKLKG